MEIVRKILRLRALVDEARQTGKSIAFVPTMGSLHEGHLSLVRQARERAQEVVVSIFVNPKQFERDGDLRAYPRDLTRDAELLTKEGVRILFAPDLEEIYPKGFSTHVDVEGLSGRLIGETRPGHFRGVATIVLKLLNIVRPDLAVFGWKDAQQLVLIKRMVRDLDLQVEIFGVNTVRESDGLAASSRNRLLDEPARKAATAIFRSLQEGRRLIDEGERSAEAVAAAVRKGIEEEELLEIDHVECVDAESFDPPKRLRDWVLISVSVTAKVEGREPVRLIDNVRIEIEDEKS
jgi:pantoate--beta-alanine ligase